MYLQCCLDVTLQVPHETAAISAHLLCAPQNRVYSFIQSHIHRVHGCLTVTCHLHFGGMTGDLTPTTAVTQRRNWYQNLKMDPGKKYFPAALYRWSCRQELLRPLLLECQGTLKEGFLCIVLSAMKQEWTGKELYGSTTQQNGKHFTLAWGLCKNLTTYLINKLSIKIFKVFLYTHVKCK